MNARPATAVEIEQRPIGRATGLLQSIGNTPLVELRRVRSEGGAADSGQARGLESGRLAVEEGLFVGMSSGAAVRAAVQVAAGLPPSETVVTLLPDRGDRYLSTNLFRSVCAECPP